ncbi:MAG: flagellar filament capping protein FliD, partial [Bacillota bacterium]
ATTAVRGANLQRRWVNETSLLSAYNGGKGVSLGTFKITNSAGVSKEIDLTVGTYNTLGDVINLINSKALGVTASINANGDGLLLTDTAGGGSKLKVEDVTGRSAADLNILGTATDTTIDGSFEKTFTLTADDTLSTALDTINAPGFAVAGILVNDGSGATPYRVSFSARNTGRNGRFIFDGGTTALQASTLVDAQDAVVFYGGTSGQQPVTITSSTNHLTNVIKGLTIDLNGVSNSPVTVNVSQNVDNVVSELQKFADNFNGLVDKLNELTKFDSETETRGILLGDGTVQQVQERIYTFFQTAVKDAGTYKMLSEVGLTIGEGSKITFDEEKFRTAYTASPDSVNKLFTTFQKGDNTTPAKKGIATFIEDQINTLTDPVNGAIARQNQALDQRAQQFQDRIDQLDKLLESKRTRLERQFSNMETVLSKLQAQQSSLSSITGLITSSSSKSSSSN